MSLLALLWAYMYNLILDANCNIKPWLCAVFLLLFWVHVIHCNNNLHWPLFLISPPSCCSCGSLSECRQRSGWLAGSVPSRCLPASAPPPPSLCLAAGAGVGRALDSSSPLRILEAGGVCDGRASGASCLCQRRKQELNE